jgi:integrase
MDTIKESLLAGFESQSLKEGKAIATVNSTIRVLRSTLNHAIEDGLLDFALQLRLVKGANVRKWVLLPEQEEKYLEACTEPFRTVATIILDAGLRSDECFRFRWENVRFLDAKRAVLVVPGTKTAAAARPVPRTPRVRAMIESRWILAGKATSGWVFPAKRAKSGHMVDNTVDEPHTNAVKKIGLSTHGNLFCTLCVTPA